MRDPVILSAVRTPIGKFQGALKHLTATQLGSLIVRAAVERAGVSPEQVDEVIMGNVISAGLGGGFRNDWGTRPGQPAWQRGSGFAPAASPAAFETAARGGKVTPVSGDSRLYIYPGFEFRVVDVMVTNFHLPESSLLMLVCAFAGREQTLAAYRHAVAQRYRFFSYGDAMLVTPKPRA